MVFVFDEKRNIIGYDFSDNEREAIKACPDLAKVIIDGFSKYQEEITTRANLSHEIFKDIKNNIVSK